MKNRFFIPILLLCIAFGRLGFAQVPQDISSLSPNAAALFKTLDRPIGSYTGTVPVNFPLMSIGSGNLSANLSLIYNSTGGIKIDEVAGSVGLGFSLNDGGGRIVQVVKDLSDFSDDGMLNSGEDLNGYPCSVANLQKNYDEELDLQPDIFMFNFNGKNGRFFFTQTGDIVMLQKTGIKVVRTNDYQWIITDEQGNTYYFGAGKTEQEPTSHENYSLGKTSPYYGNKIYLRSWYLAEVYDINEDNKISYEYVATNDSFVAFTPGFLGLYANNDCEDFGLRSDPSSINYITGEQIVSRIEVNDGDHGYITISTSGNRLDGSGENWRGKKVDDIKLYSPDDTLIKQYKFNYSYFNENASDYDERRLKLDSFSEWGQSTTDNLLYQFEYDDTDGELPTRYSNAHDHWGYYNAYSSLSKKYNNIGFPDIGLNIWGISFANRKSREAYAQKNILTKITYPTGKERIFKYEGNTALTQGIYGYSAYGPISSPHHPGKIYNQKNTPVGGVRVKAVIDYDPLTKKEYKTTYQYKLYSTDSTLTSGLLVRPLDLVVNGVPPYLLSQQPPYYSDCDFDKLLGTTSSSGPQVVYPEVRTRLTSNGWTDRTYSFVEDDVDNYRVPAWFVDKSHERGLLLEEKIYTEDENLLKLVTHEYDATPQTNTIQYGWLSKSYFEAFEWEMNRYYLTNLNPYKSDPVSTGFCTGYSLKPHINVLKKTTDITYIGTESIVNETEYIYDHDTSSPNNLFLKEQKLSLHNGDIRTKTYNYNFTPNGDFVFGAPSTAIKNTLQTKNYLAPLEESNVLLVNGSGNEVLLGGVKYDITNNSNKIRLNKAETYAGLTKVNSINFSSYGALGQLQEQYQDNGTKEITVWGYNNQYPVAKIVGSDYATIISGLTSSDIDDLHSLSTTDAQKRTVLNKIRTNLISTTALVSTYTYAPFVGVTSETDPKGYTTYYEYDDFNRLIKTKDADGHILEQTQYHYKN